MAIVLLALLVILILFGRQLPAPLVPLVGRL